MTRLFDARHGVVHELIKALSSAGMTAEDAEWLLANKSQIPTWVDSLPMRGTANPQDAGRIPVSMISLNDRRVRNTLTRCGFRYLDEVAQCTYDDLREIQNMGKGSVDALLAILQQHDLRLAEVYDGPSPLIKVRVRRLFRGHIMDMEIGQVLYLEYSDQTGARIGQKGLTFAELLKLTDEQRVNYYTPAGLTKIYEFLAANM